MFHTFSSHPSDRKPPGKPVPQVDPGSGGAFRVDAVRGAVGVEPLVSCGKAAFFMGKSAFFMGKPEGYAIHRAVEWIMAIEMVETMPLIAWWFSRG